jgi:hypothetical protein
VSISRRIVRKEKGYLEVTSMLHSQVSYQVHPNPCSTNGAYLKGISTNPMSL